MGNHIKISPVSHYPEAQIQYYLFLGTGDLKNVNKCSDDSEYVLTFSLGAEASWNFYKADEDQACQTMRKPVPLTFFSSGERLS